MGVPRLSRTVRSLLEKRGIVKPKAARSVEVSEPEAATSSTVTTTTPTVVAETTKPSGATFSAKDTLSLSYRPTSAPRALSDYAIGFPGDIADTLSPDLRKRIDLLQTYWGADDPGRVVDHIIYLCLNTNGDWREQDVETVVKTYLDAVGVV